MLAVKGFYNGDTFVSIQKIPVKKNQKVIITILDEYIDENKRTTNSIKDFYGILDDQSYLEFSDALKDCEKVDFDGW